MPAQVGLSNQSYDKISRLTEASHPEQPSNGPSRTIFTYQTLQTTGTDPKGYRGLDRKNGLGELKQSQDDNGFAVNYLRDASGNIKEVSRTPNNGDAAGRNIATTLSFDRLGRKTQMLDPDKGSWGYQYNALGELIEQRDGKGQTTRLYYDALGRLWQRTEERRTASGLTAEPTSTWVFDTATLPGSFQPALGLLHSVGNGAHLKTLEYDAYGRPSRSITTIEGRSYYQRQTYDAFGRPFQSFAASEDPNSFEGTLTEYSDDGYPIKTRESANGISGTVYQEILALDARGQVRQERLGQSDNLVTTKTYDELTGRLLTIQSQNGILQDWTYTYDKHSNVTSRYNQAGFSGARLDLKEEFSYDNLNRLTEVRLTRFNGINPNQVTQNVRYDQLGNILQKNGSAYRYQATACGSAGPHAVSQFNDKTYCYDQNGNQTETRRLGLTIRQITYTGYDLPDTIARNDNGINATSSFRYAPDRSYYQRIDNGSSSAGDAIFQSGFENNESTTPTVTGGTNTIYVGEVEFIQSGAITQTKRYVGGYLIITKTSGATQYDYLFKDALGSIDVITNELGQIRQRLSFDAYGNRRYADPPGAATLWGLIPAASAATFDTRITRAGYTGQEQLDGVGLIHYGGRLYDPELGRFIQADPLVEPEATQGLNRYSYVLNNPLTYTDPTGYLTFRQGLGLAVGIAFAAWSGQFWAANALAASFSSAVAGGFISAAIATGNLRAAAWGALSAAVFWGIGTGFSKVVTSYSASSPGIEIITSRVASGSQIAKVAAHSAAGGVLNTLQGGKFGHGFVTAGVTEALSPAISQTNNIVAGTIVSAVVGGTVSELSDGSFANGATTGAFQYLFNSSVHEAGCDEQCIIDQEYQRDFQNPMRRGVEASGQAMSTAGDIVQGVYEATLPVGAVLGTAGKLIGASIGKSSSRALGIALEANGIIRPAGVAAHHIVAGNAKMAAPAQTILKRFAIGINEADNGVFLPIAAHQRLHTRRYYESVNQMLLQATNRQQVIEVLHAVRMGLQNGTFP